MHTDVKIPSTLDKNQVKINSTTTNKIAQHEIQRPIIWI